MLFAYYSIGYWKSNSGLLRAPKLSSKNSTNVINIFKFEGRDWKQSIMVKTIPYFSYMQLLHVCLILGIHVPLSTPEVAIECRAGYKPRKQAGVCPPQTNRINKARSNLKNNMTSTKISFLHSLREEML